LVADAAPVSGINSSTALWYASRATGVVALLLLTMVMLLGLLVARGGRQLPGLPRFAVGGLHRNLSLLAVMFVTVHVLTAVLDGYVHIPLTAALVPLASPYERFWLGLGAVSVDLMLAAVATSLVRGRLSRRTWRAVHLTAYLSWPVAWLHSVFAGSDLQRGPLLVLALGCAAAVIAAAAARLAAAARAVPRAERVARLMDTVPSDTAEQTPAPRERTLTR
jgi:sulfoxide reductase heme-binding subunit YedZ